MGYRNFGSKNYSVTYHVAKCVSAMEQLYIVTTATKPIHVIIQCNRAITCWYKCLKGCMFKKQHKEPFLTEGRLCTTVQVIGLVHYDVWGSTKTISLGGI
jgi:hypothetical protein